MMTTTTTTTSLETTMLRSSLSARNMISSSSSSCSATTSLSSFGSLHKGKHTKELEDSEHTSDTEELSETASFAEEEEEEEEEEAHQPQHRYYVADPQQPKSKKQRRRVGFRSTGKLVTIDSHTTYSEQERHNCWYSPKEREEMMAQVYQVVGCMITGKPETSTMTYRGLEKWTTEGAKEHEIQIRRTVHCVLEEEKEQWDQGIDDELAIAFICRNVTAISVQKARRVAWEDEQEAIAIERSKLFLLGSYHR